MIKIKDLEKIYRTEDVETVALNKLSVEVGEGEFVAIMGPSGCGKSTLLNILGLLDDPDSGSFLFNGIEVAHFNERKRADLRKRNIGFVFQSFNLIDELTVFENVELPLIYLGIKAPERKERVEKVLDKMDSRFKVQGWFFWCLVSYFLVSCILFSCVLYLVFLCFVPIIFSTPAPAYFHNSHSLKSPPCPRAAVR